MEYGLHSINSGQGPEGGSCGHGNKRLESLEYWEILDYLRDWQLLKDESAPWNY